MKIEHTEPGFAILKLTTDDLWSLRHCAVEALEALGTDEVEFRVRVGATVADVEALVRDLKRVAKLTQADGTPPGS
ncbi:MAG TPA: hypothetical protein VFY82_06765 [Acidimicrobiales bacterium]|nr:hypothetical protein [Acidimicrobiales bacterium]